MPIYFNRTSVKALHSYTARTANELSFLADDIIMICDITSEHWWLAIFKGNKGYVPATYVAHDIFSEIVVDANEYASMDLSAAPVPPKIAADDSHGGLFAQNRQGPRAQSMSLQTDEVQSQFLTCMFTPSQPHQRFSLSWRKWTV